MTRKRFLIVTGIMNTCVLANLDTPYSIRKLVSDCYEVGRSFGVTADEVYEALDMPFAKLFQDEEFFLRPVNLESEES